MQLGGIIKNARAQEKNKGKLVEEKWKEKRRRMRIEDQGEEVKKIIKRFCIDFFR